MSEQEIKLPYPYVVRFWVKDNIIKNILIEGPFPLSMNAFNYGRNLATKAAKNEEVFFYTSFSLDRDKIMEELAAGPDSPAAKGALVRLYCW